MFVFMKSESMAISHLANGLMAGVMLVAMGCGGKPAPIPVNGSVSFKGNPVANVVVTFAPKSPEGEYARGETDAGGKIINVSTSRPGDGIRPGEYSVAITMPPQSYAPEGDAIDYSVVSTPPFPAKYQDVAVSDLRITVGKGNENQFDLELKD